MAGPRDADRQRLTAIYRAESGRCVATLIRVLGDVDLAEDAVADAFAIAAQRWPTEGFPPNPGGWITTTARNRAIDVLRRESSRHRRQREAHRLLTEDGAGPEAVGPAIDGDVDVVPDDQLRLIFLCCHPALAPDAQVALTLRLLGGLETAEIARAFLVPTATMAQRLVRAKRKIRDSHMSYRIPGPDELAGRLEGVLATVYIVFNEGYLATSGDSLTRQELSAEAIRLGRLLVELLPGEPEIMGLVALMLLTEARRPARLDDDGGLVRLADQDRRRWNRTLIDEGHRLVRACLARDRPGRYQLQAAIAAVHADATASDDTDWSQIVALYDHLALLRPDAIVRLNRAIAVAERDGPEAGLVALDGLPLEHYHLFHAARGELLERSGQTSDARHSYDRALELVENDVERHHLTQRRDQVGSEAGS